MTIHPLPRSLDPLPDESLPGYLLRLAHRLDLSPATVAMLTGLSTGKTGQVASSRMLFTLDATAPQRSPTPPG